MLDLIALELHRIAISADVGLRECVSLPNSFAGNAKI